MSKETMKIYEQGSKNGYISAINDAYKYIKDTTNDKTIIQSFYDKFAESIYDVYAPEGTPKPTKYELKHCFVEDFTYRGITSKIFIDDYGQCYYVYINGEQDSTSFGTYTSLEYVHEDLKSIIDDELDLLYRYSKPFFGAQLRKKDDKVQLIYRQECYAEYENNIDIQVLVSLGLNKLKEITSDPEYQKKEQERLANNDLYIHEIMNKNEEGE